MCGSKTHFPLGRYLSAIGSLYARPDELHCGSVPMSAKRTFARFVTAVLLLVVFVGSMLVASAPVRTADGGTVSSVGATGTPVDASRTAVTTADQPITEFATVEGFDDVQIHIQVATDRSATWSVKYRYRLDDESTNQAFERVRRNVTDPPGVFIERMREAARRAEQRTGREMGIQNGTVSAFRSAPHGRFGIVEYRFTWVGFAASEDGGRVVVGDVLNGYPLGENESLVFSWPDRFSVDEVSPPPDTTRESAVRWNGPHEFGVENPRLVLAAGGEQPVTTSVAMFVVGTLAVVSVVVLVFRVGPTRLVALVAPQRAEEETEHEDETPTELLSDEERVLRLLEENGGRMRQQEVKDALGWSRTKTSNVVNSLRKDDAIEVYRIGRENTLALPGEMDV